MSELAHPDQTLASRLMRYLALARASLVMLPNVHFFSDSETVLPSREAVARSLEEADKLLGSDIDTEAEIAQGEARLRHYGWCAYRLGGSCYISRRLAVAVLRMGVAAGFTTIPSALRFLERCGPMTLPIASRVIKPVPALC